MKSIYGYENEDGVWIDPDENAITQKMIEDADRHSEAHENGDEGVGNESTPSRDECYKLGGKCKYNCSGLCKEGV